MNLTTKECLYCKAKYKVLKAKDGNNFCNNFCQLEYERKNKPKYLLRMKYKKSAYFNY